MNKGYVFFLKFSFYLLAANQLAAMAIVEGISLGYIDYFRDRRGKKEGGKKNSSPTPARVGEPASGERRRPELRVILGGKAA